MPASVLNEAHFISQFLQVGEQDILNYPPIPDAPINTITRAVPRIPMSRLLMSIDFITVPLTKVYGKPIFIKSGI